MIDFAVNFLGFCCGIFSLNKYLHVFQLKNYSYARYLKYFKKYYIFYVFCFVLCIFSLFFNNSIKFLLKILVLIIEVLLNFKIIKSKKTPLKFTSKIKRLHLISVCILILCSTVKIFCFALPTILIFLPIVASVLNFYDYIKNKKFIHSAQEKLKKQSTKIIAITGSNGKTSVKNILFEILNSTYKVQATPASFNTPIGISKFINEDLKNNTEFLILEYGARHKNDIKKLCKLFGADYGIVTCVAKQHLETFKTLNNVYLAKNELPNYLNKKLCIFNFDNELTRKMFYEKQGNKIGVSVCKNSKICAKSIKIKGFLTYFTLEIDKLKFSAHTQLLGKHNVTNILLATALAIQLKIEPEKIVEAIKNLKPIPHRLQYIKGSVNILDDSYNCSILSAENSLKVLKHCSGKKMVVTPGIIEGGKEQFNININLGKMCAFANFIVIVGEENKKALLTGIANSKTNAKIFCVNSLDEATQKFNLLSCNDTLLLLNDLPDDYK